MKNSQLPSSKKLFSFFSYKNSIRLLICFLAISFIISCKKDKFFEETSKIESSSAKKISLNDLENAINGSSGVDLNKISAKSSTSQLID